MSDDAVADLALNQRGGARRREDIVEAARQAGTLVVADLPGQFGVSPETTHRRDDFLVHRAGAFATPGTHHHCGWRKGASSNTRRRGHVGCGHAGVDGIGLGVYWR